MSRLSVTISAPIILIGVLAIALNAYLSVGKLDRTLNELEQSRLHLILDDLRDNLETGLDLGLPLKSLGNAQAAIEREARQDGAIVGIRVLDADGAPVFSTGDPAHGAPLRAALSNNLGVAMGAIELRYARQADELSVAAYADQLARAAAWIAATGALLALAAIRFWMRRIGRTVDTIASTLDRKPPPPHPDPEAAILAGRARERADHALRELEQATRAMREASLQRERP
ncbi:hypothetical protein H3H37_15440 [Duganella sp. LX20W]|uniref:HAMP domain-containing protein n=1 Tax=Rugamonas brunnea TaxID=2758569 RepID=A0A7W2ETR7_9BURK|nr:hypothetical protein [Rugamonas brunnea]MBA5638452.1 hypothetical protein [Rugamonas brunnea]